MYPKDAYTVEEIADRLVEKHGDKKIEAIKDFRQLTGGVDLSECKKAIDKAFERRTLLEARATKQRLDEAIDILRDVADYLEVRDEEDSWIGQRVENFLGSF